MPRVFDTSSLMALFLDDGAPEMSVVFDEHVLDLTFYEDGNVLWKAHSLQDRLTTEQHERLTALLSDLRAELTVHTLEEIGTATVMAVAAETRLTFYDAAHLACAIELDSTLVTEDESLREAAADRVEVADIETVGEDI